MSSPQLTRSVLGLLLLIALQACGDSEPTAPPAEIIGVQMTPATARFEFLGQSRQLAARVLRDNGSIVQNPELSWATTDPDIVTVDSEGRVTATGPGTADVTATFAGLVGTTNVVVSTPDCVNTVDLAPGQWETLSLGCAVQIPAGSAGDRYRVAVVRQESAEDENAVTTVTVGAAGVAVASPPPASLRARPEARRPVASPDDVRDARRVRAIAAATERDHVARRRAEAELWQRLQPTHDPRWIERRRAERRLTNSPSAVDSPSRITIRKNPGNSCTLTPATPAFLMAENDFIAIYQDSVIGADPSTQITAEHAQQMLDYYEAYGADVIEDYFGGVPDLDGNQKMIALVSFATQTTGGLVAGYVWGGDLFPADECETSNEAEVMYLNAGLIRALDEDFDQALDVVVHEAKHIASFWQGYRRSLRSNTTAFQPLWIEEGSAEIAANVAARASWRAGGGPAVNERVTVDVFSDLAVGDDNRVIDAAANLVGRFVNTQRYLASQPNGLVVSPFGADEGHSIYGSGWTFLRWFGDTYGNAASAPFADADFFLSLSDSLAAAGVAGLEAASGRSFSTLLEEYAAGLMLHGTEFAPATGVYTSYDFALIEEFCFGADNPPCEGSPPGPAGMFPWPVTTQSDGEMSIPFASGTFTGATGNGGIRIHEFASSGTSDLQLTVEAAQPSGVVVARIR